MTKTFKLKNTFKKLIISSALVLPSVCLAAGNATIEVDGSNMDIHWVDTKNARFNMPGDEGYLLSKDGKTYMVSDEDGDPMVVEVAGMAQMAMAFAGDGALDHIIPDSISKVKATGKKEKIAGIKGEVYILTITDSDGAEEEIEVVLTDNKVSNELTDVYISLLQNIFGINHMQDMFDQLPKKKRGILRVDDELIITSLSKKGPDSDYLELPAQPMNLQNLMQDLQKALQGFE